MDLKDYFLLFGSFIFISQFWFMAVQHKEICDLNDALVKYLKIINENDLKKVDPLEGVKPSQKAEGVIFKEISPQCYDVITIDQK